MTNVTPFENGRWWVKSRSRAHVKHLVEIDASGEYACDCESFTKHEQLHGTPCIHLEQVVTYIEAMIRHTEKTVAICATESDPQPERAEPLQTQEPKRRRPTNRQQTRAKADQEHGRRNAPRQDAEALTESKGTRKSEQPPSPYKADQHQPVCHRF